MFNFHVRRFYVNLSVRNTLKISNLIESHVESLLRSKKQVIVTTGETCSKEFFSYRVHLPGKIQTRYCGIESHKWKKKKNPSEGLIWCSNGRIHYFVEDESLGSVL